MGNHEEGWGPRMTPPRRTHSLHTQDAHRPLGRLATTTSQGGRAGTRNDGTRTRHEGVHTLCAPHQLCRETRSNKTDPHRDYQTCQNGGHAKVRFYYSNFAFLLHPGSQLSGQLTRRLLFVKPDDFSLPPVSPRCYYQLSPTLQ